MDYIINLFVNENNNILQFNIILLFFIIIVCFSKIFGLETSTYIIILSMFAIFICNNYVKNISNNIIDSNKEVYFKLQILQEKMYEYIQYKINHTTLGTRKLSERKQQELYEDNKLSSLYINSNLINFLYNIVKMYDYNPNEYYLLIKNTNDILRLQREIEEFNGDGKTFPENIQEMLESAIELRVNCINNIQNFIYSVPKTKKMYNYITTILNTYYSLITVNIKQINIYYNINIKQKGINSMTKFINTSGNFAKDFDIIDNYSVIPSKLNNNNNLKLIDLYV